MSEEKVYTKPEKTDKVKKVEKADPKFNYDSNFKGVKEDAKTEVEKVTTTVVNNEALKAEEKKPNVEPEKAKPVFKPNTTKSGKVILATNHHVSVKLKDGTCVYVVNDKNYKVGDTVTI